MSLSPSGVLSGTPAAAGTFAVTVTATDSATHTGSKRLSLVINNSYTISGQITLSGAGLSGVTVTLSTGPTATTNSSGNYSFSNLPTGTYTVTPSRSGYIFTPSSTTFPNITANQTANFTASIVTTMHAVSIKFVGTGAAMGASESAGVVAKTNWNNATGNSSSSALNLVDETGALNGAGATWTSDVSWNLPITDSPGNVRMMRGYIDTLSGGDSTTVTVMGLPASSTGYDIYVYTDGDNATATKTATYQLSGAGITAASITVTDPANTNFGGTFTQANNSAGNYVKFTAVQATAFTITATPKTASNGVLRAPVNGIQVAPH
jgi:hypothetical protein